MKQHHVLNTSPLGVSVGSGQQGVLFDASNRIVSTTGFQGGLRLFHRRLTSVMADQLLQRGEGDPRRDVESSVVQRSDLVVFDGVSGRTVSDGQRVASCAQTYNNS